jgi:hypothetical protein
MLTIEQETVVYASLVALQTQALRIQVIAGCYADSPSLNNRLNDIAHEINQSISAIKSAATNIDSIKSSVAA